MKKKKSKKKVDQATMKNSYADRNSFESRLLLLLLFRRKEKKFCYKKKAHETLILSDFNRFSCCQSRHFCDRRYGAHK